MLIYVWGNRYTVRLSSLPKVTQLIAAEGFKSCQFGFGVQGLSYLGKLHPQMKLIWLSKEVQTYLVKASEEGLGTQQS